MISEHEKDEAIKAEPTQKLYECLELKRTFGIDEDERETQELCEIVKENFATAVELCNDEQFEFIRKIISIMNENNGIVEDLPIGFYTFYFNNFIYLFFWEDKFHLVIPDELTEIYQDKINEKDFAEINSRYQEMAIYARALMGVESTS